MLIKQQIENNNFVELLDKTNNNNIERAVYYIKRGGGINYERSKILFDRFYDKREFGIDLDEIIERTLLILLNDGLIYFILNKHFDYDQDLYSIGKMGLIKAVDTYDINKNSFATYASRVIMNEILMHKRNCSTKIEGKQKIASLDESLDIEAHDGEKDCSLYGIIPDEEDFVEEVTETDLCKYVVKFIKYLTPTEQQILVYSYGLFNQPVLTQMQISQKLNIGQAYVSRLLSKIPDKLKILMNGENGNSEQYNKIMQSYYKNINANKESGLEFKI